jgi:hypothetical protein
MGEADGMDGEVANEFSREAVGGTPRGEDERDGGRTAIGGRWTQRDLIQRISRGARIFGERGAA